MSPRPIDIIELSTPRLHLRAWQKQDWPAFAKINADPDVMKYYPSTLSTRESNDLADKISTTLTRQGWGFWAVELKISSQFLGFVGLNHPDYELTVNPCTEIGWRLARPFWGMGYATEAGRLALDYGFTQLALTTIYSVTPIDDQRSIEIMKRLGMANTNQNFEHPIIPSDHPLCEHVLYRKDNLTP